MNDMAVLRFKFLTVRTRSWKKFVAEVNALCDKYAAEKGKDCAFTYELDG